LYQKEKKERNLIYRKTIRNILFLGCLTYLLTLNFLSMATQNSNPAGKSVFKVRKPSKGLCPKVIAKFEKVFADWEALLFLCWWCCRQFLGLTLPSF